MQKKDKDDVILTKLKENLFKHGIILDHNLLTILTRKDGKSNYRIGIWGDLVCADWKADGIYKKIWHEFSSKDSALKKIGSSIVNKLNDYELEKQYKITGVTNDDPIVRTLRTYDPIHHGWTKVDETGRVATYRKCFLQDLLHTECDRHCAVKAICKSDDNKNTLAAEKIDQINTHFFEGHNLETIINLNAPSQPEIPIKEKESIGEVRIIHSGQDIEEYFK